MRNLLPLIWRGNKERYSLFGSQCETCRREYFPQRRICPNCRRKGKIVEKKMPEEGKITSYTLVHSAPAGFELESPYHLALIELANGVKVLSQLADSPADKVSIGAPVKMVFRKIFEDEEEGAIAYGYKFTVSGAAPAAQASRGQAKPSKQKFNQQPWKKTKSSPAKSTNNFS